jgi:hypothetical protein
MHSVKFRGCKAALLPLLLSIAISGNVFAAEAASSTLLSTPGSIGGNYSINADTLKQLASSIPNYGGTFVPGIGNTVTAIGAPVMDAASIAKAVERRLQDAYEDAQKLLMDNALTKAIGLSGQNKVDAQNNAGANMVVRVNKAIEDENNLDAVKNSMVSTDACRDIAISMGGKLGSGCEAINSLRESYLGRSTSSTASTLMTVARGLNSAFSTEESNDLIRINRIAKKYTADLKLSSPKGVYSPSRFADEDVQTFDADQMADLPDFIYVQMRPHLKSNVRIDTMSVKTVTGTADQVNATGESLSRQLASDVFADSFTDKVPGDSSISPYESMREFAKGKNSVEYLQKIETGQEMNPVLLKREQVIMLASKIHQQVVGYQRSLKQEQVAARRLDGVISRSDASTQ